MLPNFWQSFKFRKYIFILVFFFFKVITESKGYILAKTSSLENISDKMCNSFMSLSQAVCDEGTS